MQTMIAHTNAKARGHPEKEDGHRKTGPIEHKKRRNCADMEKRQSDNRRQVHLLAVVDVDNGIIHGSSGFGKEVLFQTNRDLAGDL